MSIETMKRGDTAIVSGYCTTLSSYRSKLLALGFTRGVKIQLVGVAPMGDPICLRLRGFEVSLRREEAKALLVDKMQTCCGNCATCHCGKGEH